MLNITDVHGKRFELALERLREGHPFSFEGVNFWLAPDSSLEISVNSSWAPDNITEQRALKDLGRAQRVYQSLCSDSARFAAMTKNHLARFILSYDYGSGSIEVGRLVNEMMVWAKGLK